MATLADGKSAPPTCEFFTGEGRTHGDAVDSLKRRAAQLLCRDADSIIFIRLKGTEQYYLRYGSKLHDQLVTFTKKQLSLFCSHITVRSRPPCALPFQLFTGKGRTHADAVNELKQYAAQCLGCHADGIVFIRIKGTERYYLRYESGLHDQQVMFEKTAVSLYESYITARSIAPCSLPLVT